MNWQSDALTALKQDLPFFVRPAVSRRVESMALEAGRQMYVLTFIAKPRPAWRPNRTIQD